MQIKWLGHSCFLLTSSNGTTILTDPFNISLGYKPFTGKLDIVTISHNHFDHNNINEIIFPKNNLLNKPGSYNISNISIKGIPSYHDKLQGLKRGPIVIFTFNIDGYTICHLGDLGYVLSKEEVLSLGSVDILLVPIGGNYTIDGREASTLCNLINSHIIIPMHYKTSNLTSSLDGLDSFLSKIKNGDKINANYIDITNDIYSLKNSVKILDYKPT